MTTRDTNIEAIYPLTPAQEGILFHTLYASDAPLYFQQYTCSIGGALDSIRFRESWQRVIDRYPPLRSFLTWEGREQPLQVVRSRVQPEWYEADWRPLPPSEQRQRLDEFLESDRGRGFQLDVAPLTRFALVRTGDETHQFVWSHQHVILDGWSMGIVLDEVFRHYEAAGSGRELDLRPAASYRDYGAWLKTRDLDAAEGFWRATLRGFDRPTGLPVGGPVGRGRWAERHADETVRLTAAATARLGAFARSEGVTLNTMLRGAWALVLSRYSGEDDVVFGATVSGRPPELEGSLDAVGLFINTLPVRVALTTGATVGDWLRSIQQWQVDAGPFETTPLQAVQGWSELPAGESLFETLLAFENVPDFAVGTGTLDVDDVQYLQRSNYPLAVLVMPGTELEIILLYDADRFDRGIIRRMAGQLRHVLEALSLDGERDLGSVPLFPGEELDEIVNGWNVTGADYPANRTMHALVEEAAAAFPQREAVVGSDVVLSYETLDERAETIASHLRRLGVGPDQCVGVDAARSPGTVVAMLAVLKAGGAYVPIDPDLPPRRTGFLLGNTSARAVIGGAGTVAALAGDGERPVVVIDSAGNLIEASEVTDGAAALRSPTPDDLAYIMYTSGSSGSPKGVAVTHRNLANSTHARMHAYGEPVGRFLLLSPFFFDSSVAGFFSTLTQGGTLVLPEPRMEQDVDHLADLIGRHRVTHTLALPTIYGLLLELTDTQKLESLKLVMVAGESCPPGLVVEHQRRLPGTRLVNEYGPTEATVWCTVEQLAPPEPHSRGEAAARVSIGRPIANTQAFILDDRERPVPVGVPGQLHIGGLGLARGYVGSPDLTARSFREVELPLRGPTRLYATGDVARFLPDGSIDLLGRADHQIKIRGQRIELGEIEAVLKEHPAVRDAAAVVRDRGGTVAKIVAYVEATSDPDELRRFAAGRLPDAMVPSTVVVVDSLPRGATGKVDRRSLRDIATPSRPAPDGFVAPVGDTERKLASIWAAVLGRDAVGATDNFFELGGDSILSIRVIARAHREGVAITPKQFFDHPTVSGLAAVAGQPDG